MPAKATSNKEIPYHLRAPRLKWAAFAVTLEEEELARVQAVAANPLATPSSRMMAGMMLALHHREDITKICGQLHVTRRKLLEFGDRLATVEGRRKLLAQPRTVRSRRRLAPF